MLSLPFIAQFPEWIPQIYQIWRLVQDLWTTIDEFRVNLDLFTRTTVCSDADLFFFPRLCFWSGVWTLALVSYLPYKCPSLLTWTKQEPKWTLLDTDIMPPGHAHWQVIPHWCPTVDPSPLTCQPPTGMLAPGHATLPTGVPPPSQLMCNPSGHCTLPTDKLSPTDVPPTTGVPAPGHATLPTDRSFPTDVPNPTGVPSPWTCHPPLVCQSLDMPPPTGVSVPGYATLPSDVPPPPLVCWPHGHAIPHWHATPHRCASPLTAGARQWMIWPLYMTPLPPLQKRRWSLWCGFKLLTVSWLRTVLLAASVRVLNDCRTTAHAKHRIKVALYQHFVSVLSVFGVMSASSLLSCKTPPPLTEPPCADPPQADPPLGRPPPPF